MAPIPTWLKESYTEAHLESVFRVLGTREDMRRYARHLSLSPPDAPKSHTSQTRSSSPPSISSTHGNDSPTSHYSVAVSHQSINFFRNRYSDIEPYDRTRVIVPIKESEGRTEKRQGRYLNANWVLENFGRKWWIASQAPLPHTAHTFLSLLLQPIAYPLPLPDSKVPSHPPSSRVRTIVQLTRNHEHGRVKAHPYFPQIVGKHLLILPDDRDVKFALKTTLLQKRTVEVAECVISTVSVALVPLPPHQRHIGRPRMDESGSKSGFYLEGNEREWDEEIGEAVTFQHLFYTAWPDHGVPAKEDEESLLRFMSLVNQVNRSVSSAQQSDGNWDQDPPIIIGCSAGVGRTGSFIALSSLLRMYDLLPATPSPTAPSDVLPASPLGALPQEMSQDLVALEIDSLREQRPQMVQREEQIVLIYEMLAAAFRDSDG